MENKEISIPGKNNTKKIALLALITVIFILLVIAVLFYYHPSKKVTVPFLTQENNLHVFSSPNMSFNFTNYFILGNSTPKLSNYSNSARLYLYYNGSQNNSIAITLAQNKQNTSFSFVYKLLKSEFNTSSYSFRNLSISNYSAFEVLSSKPSITYAIVFVHGPSDYYTAVAVSDNYSKYVNIVDSGLNKILSTLNFNYSPYLK